MPSVFLSTQKQYSGPHLIRPLDNWASCLIGPDCRGHDSLPAHVIWSPHLIGPNSSVYFETKLSGTHCIAGTAAFLDTFLHDNFSSFKSRHLRI